MAYRHFTEMPVWQKAHRLVLLIYRVSGRFPRDERYELRSQVRRAAVSVSSNIAEGFGRHHSNDKAQFYRNARGSLYEVENQLIIARDLGYVDEEQQRHVSRKVGVISHDLNKIVKTLTN